MREILSIRRQGLSSIGEVHNRLLLLKQENDRLRQSQATVEEVEKLMTENRSLKQVLQKLKPDVTSGHLDSNKDMVQDFPSNLSDIEYNDAQPDISRQLSNTKPHKMLNL